MIYPWQTKQWEHLWYAKQVDRLPHALLFSGMAGVGKVDFANTFVHALLCQTVAPDNMPCGACHACRLITGKTHPNVLEVIPEKPGQAIKVDQIRHINEFLQQSAFQGAYKVVVIHPADSMNASAANALLKILEEPSSGSLLLLISDQHARLPKTVLSRCQRVVFPRPDQHAALTWLQEHLSTKEVNAQLLLQLANGAPLAALQLAKEDLLIARQELINTLSLLSQHKADPIKSSAQIQAIDTLQLLDICFTIGTDLLRLHLKASVVNDDVMTYLSSWQSHVLMQKNIEWLDYIKQLRHQIIIGINLNKQLLIESVLVKWMACYVAG